MNAFTLFPGTLDPALLPVSKGETAARLGIPREFSCPEAEQLLPRLREAANPVYVYTKATVSRTGTDAVDLGFGILPGHDLSRALEGCDTAYVLAVTLGLGSERFLRTPGELSSRFFADALASSLAESACDEVERIIRLLEPGASFCPRFSPGYGDLPLTVQKPLLETLDARRLLGITLSPTCIMTPMKSITAILGVKHD